MKVLHLTLSARWFAMILSGEKKEEYREHKHYWKQRLVKDGYWHSQTCKDFDRIVFKNGYAKDAPTMEVECLGITVKDNTEMNEKWCDRTIGITGRVFAIQLGKIISTKNLR